MHTGSYNSYKDSVAVYIIVEWWKIKIANYNIYTIFLAVENSEC